MKKVSILVLVCMLFSLCLVGCEEEHVCAFGTDWAYDATNHYHTCSCGAKSETAAHADADNNGACDVCAIIMSNEHVFDKEWSSDETNHWHAALCGHSVKSNEEAHTTPDAFGKCTVCGYQVTAPALATVSDALKLANLTQGTVKNGKLTTTSWGSDSLTTYEFTENYLHIKDSANYKDIYASVKADNTVFYLIVAPYDMNYYTVDANADLTYMAGPAVELINGLGVSDVVYGPVALIEYLYAFNEDETIEDFAQTVTDGVYSFTFTYSSTAVSVEFTIDEETYFVDYAKVSFGESYAYTYVQGTDVIKEYDPSDVLPTSYKLVDADGEEIDLTAPISFEVGSTYTMTFTDVVPDTAIIDMLGIKAEITNADGSDTWYAYVSNEDGVIEISVPSRAGEYLFKLTVNGTTTSIPVNVAYKAPSAIEIGVNDVAATEKTTYTGIDLTLSAVVDSGCNPAATMTLTGEGATLTKNADGTYTFNATTAGTYTVTVVSDVNAEATATLTITVTTPPTHEELVAANGKYTVDLGNGEYIDLVFDTATNTATLSGTYNWDSQAGSFTYTFENGVFTATKVDGNFNSLVITDHYTFEAELSLYYGMYTEIIEIDTFVPAEGEGGEGEGGEGEGEGNTDAIPVQGGATLDEATILDNVTATYTTTIAAGEKAYFYLSSDAFKAYNIDFTDTNPFAENPRGEYKVEWVTFEPQMAFFEFWYVNDTDAEITITFTLTFTDITDLLY